MDRPILFSAPMVRELLSGRKTQTRRAVKPQPGQAVRIAYKRPDGDFTWCLETGHGVSDRIVCPYGRAGDSLWVRESFRVEQRGDRRTGEKFDVYVYRADSRLRPEFDPLRYKPSIHMPRVASRLTLTVTETRCERLQEITEADALAEGIVRVGNRWESPGVVTTPISAADAYRSLWNYINGRDSWDANPWVWAVSFTVEAK